MPNCKTAISTKTKTENSFILFTIDRNTKSWQEFFWVVEYFIILVLIIIEINQILNFFANFVSIGQISFSSKISFIVMMATSLNPMINLLKYVFIKWFHDQNQFFQFYSISFVIIRIMFSWFVQRFRLFEIVYVLRELIHHEPNEIFFARQKRIRKTIMIWH